MHYHNIPKWLKHKDLLAITVIKNRLARPNTTSTPTLGFLLVGVHRSFSNLCASWGRQVLIGYELPKYGLLVHCEGLTSLTTTYKNRIIL